MLTWLGIVAVTTPLVASLVATVWSAFWQDEVKRPVPDGVVAALHTAQLAAVALTLVPATRTAGLLSVAAVYVVMAVGVAVLRRRRGSVPCGCFGASERPLSAKLAAFDAAVGAIAIAAARSTGDVLSGGEALWTAGLVVLLGFVAGVVVPEGRRTIERYRKVNPQNLRWVQGFRDLEGVV